jgi:hypothetical protein
MRTPGKNTWNGPNGTRTSRTRPNLFHANFFPEPSVPAESGPSPSDDFPNPNLAEWIKKALELDSDADKISHIELAIKQFEQQREGSPEYSSSSSSSLPYTHDLLSPTTTAVRKRKENGVTRIPKPSFY